MSAIKRSYPTKFYYWPILEAKKTQDIIKWASSETGPMLLFHPYLRFETLENSDRQDSMIDRGFNHMAWEDKELYELTEKMYVPEGDSFSPVVHETIVGKFDLFDKLNSLLEKIEFYFRVPEKAWLWDETGHWVAKDKDHRYIGMSEESAESLWKSKRDLTLCYVASNSSTILEFNLDKKHDDIFLLDIYHSNRFVAFPDLIEVIHKTLDEFGEWRTKNIEKNDESIIFGDNLNFISDLEGKTPLTFKVIPKWVRPIGDNPRVGGNFYDAVVIENTFFSAQKSSSSPTGYALVKYRQGYWVDKDFDEGKEYYLSFSHARKLRNCILVNMYVDIYLEEDWDGKGFW